MIALITPGMGPSGARNIGVKHARGEVIFFIDADVIPKKDSLNRIANFFTENNGYAAAHIIACLFFYETQ